MLNELLLITFPSELVVQILVYKGTAKINLFGLISSVCKNLTKYNLTQLYPAVVPGYVLELP